MTNESIPESIYEEEKIMNRKYPNKAYLNPNNISQKKDQKNHEQLVDQLLENSDCLTPDVLKPLEIPCDKDYSRYFKKVPGFDEFNFDPTANFGAVQYD